MQKSATQEKYIPGTEDWEKILPQSVHRNHDNIETSVTKQSLKIQNVSQDVFTLSLKVHICFMPDY